MLVLMAFMAFLVFGDDLYHENIHIDAENRLQLLMPIPTNHLFASGDVMQIEVDLIYPGERHRNFSEEIYYDSEKRVVKFSTFSMNGRRSIVYGYESGHLVTKEIQNSDEFSEYEVSYQPLQNGYTQQIFFSNDQSANRLQEFLVRDDEILVDFMRGGDLPVSERYRYLDGTLMQIDIVTEFSKDMPWLDDSISEITFTYIPNRGIHTMSKKDLVTAGPDSEQQSRRFELREYIEFHNEEGKVTEAQRTIYGQNGTEQHYFFSDFDNNNNWTQAVIKNEEGDVISILERSIDYF
ncbi:hypothetical protein [Salinispira pacifica]|uniref:Uncharacterized protein n=1 Tax=Salinispira pacifica TaxID=1307761 RepID=V5WHL5_9SPIO|nr:hypothetical protein [Salinispira pacifica]AHC15308.1 hypothetical protein L21SP2_1937 [Salinispira pacifica]